MEIGRTLTWYPDLTQRTYVTGQKCESLFRNLQRASSVVRCFCGRESVWAEPWELDAMVRETAGGYTDEKV